MLILYCNSVDINNDIGVRMWGGGMIELTPSACCILILVLVSFIP